jgi:phosphohistidine phosphatase SixA
VPADYADCTLQRNLSEAGREDARALGELLRDVPVTEVRTSPFCRTVDTAELAFGGATVDERLLPTQVDPGDGRWDPLLARAPADGNRVLVTHHSTIAAMTDVLVEEGEMLVLHPDGAGFEVIARLEATGPDDP